MKNNTTSQKRFALNRLSVLMGVVFLTACQSTTSQTQTPHQSLSTPNAPNAQAVFEKHAKSTDATAKERLIKALQTYLNSERTSVSRYYYQESPLVGDENSLDADADSLWVSIGKVRDYVYTGASEDYQSHAYLDNSEFLKEEDKLYLRYYDEVANTTPSSDYTLTRLDGMEKAVQSRDGQIWRYAQKYNGCVKSASYDMDALIGENPAISNTHQDVKAVYAELDGCLAKADKTLDSDIQSIATAYQLYDLKTIRQCASSYKEHLSDALANNRAIKRYEGQDYDAYDSVYGNYALCHVVFVSSYRSDPVAYMNGEATKTELDMLTYTRQCAISNKISLAELKEMGKTYATDPKDYENSFYEYFSCLNLAVDMAYNEGEGAPVDILREAKPTTMADARRAYKLHTEVVATKESERYGNEEGESEYKGFLASMFDDYFKMKKAELNKDEEKDQEDKQTGIGGIYGAMIDNSLKSFQKTPEQMQATNAYAYNNTSITILSHHVPSKYTYQGVLALEFDAPTASQSLHVPLMVDFKQEKIVLDTSALLPIGAMLAPEHTPMPSEFTGQVGVVQFDMPKQLKGIIPMSVVYDSISKGYLHSLSQFNTTIFSEVSVANDEFARSIGASRAIKVQLNSKQIGEMLALISKQLSKDLSHYVDTHPEVYSPKSDELLDVASEIAHKKRSEKAKEIKDFIEKWTLLNKGYLASDAGGIFQAIEGILPISLHQANYFYLDNQGNIVGQMLKTDSDSVMLQSRTQAIVQISHKRADFDKYPLAKGLISTNAIAFDGNAWAKVIKEELDIKKDAKELRQSYDTAPMPNAAAEAAAAAAAAMQDK